MLPNGSYINAYLFWILSPIKMKLCHILVFPMTNISNMFLTQCWRLETSLRPFYNFIELAIKWNLAIFNSWYLPFLIVPYSHFQKNETVESWNSWLLSNLICLIHIFKFWWQKSIYFFFLSQPGLIEWKTFIFIFTFLFVNSKRFMKALIEKRSVKMKN